VLARVKPQRLEAGDVLTVPQNVTHALSSGENTPPARTVVMLNSTLTIAESCGYSSEAAFSKAFKREEGIGPGEYRRRFQSNKT
jgi:AraC-like DNA-binding protein